MTEPNSVDHWAALAGDLGAKPAPDNPQPQLQTSETPSAEAESAAPAVVPPPPIFQPAAKPVRPSRRPAKPSGWDQLAGEFGIELPPQPAAEPKAVETGQEKPGATAPLPAESAPLASAAPPLAEAPEGLQPAEIVAEIEAELTAWEDLDPMATEPRSFEPQEALDVMDETADEFEDEFADEAPSATSEASAVDSEERRGRRRRRGRGRGRGRSRDMDSPLQDHAADVGEDQPFEEPSEEAAAAGQFGAGLDVESESAEGVEGEPLGEPRSERQPRGRRRGHDRHRDEPSVGSEEMPDDMRPAFAESEEDEAAQAVTEESGDFESDDELDDAAESPRIGFRNIPTWQDAIGVMIAKNLEARARNPSGSRAQGGRGRGGRGRGRGGRRPDRR